MPAQAHIKKSVLVIEDHSESCELLKHMLRRRGLYAECAESMAEGISCLDVARKSGRPFSCVVSDLSLKDSNAMQTIVALKELSNRIPVRAISGVQDPDVIEACRVARIPLILKGTSAEGIMESVLYAISERHSDPEIYEMIADNRTRAREIKQGFFHNWSGVKKAFAIAGVIATTTLSTLALGGYLYHALEDRVLSGKTSVDHFEKVDKDMQSVQNVQKDNAARIRAIEDNNIKIFAKLEEIVNIQGSNKTDYTSQLNRIEAKVDGRK